jgi:pyruvate,water dikinase
MVLHPIDILPTHSVGGKARSLAALTQEGFNIPPWFVVLGNTTELPLVHGLQAVRSSAMSEDGAENSFAGQYDSFLNVSPANIPTNIEKVRQSGSSSHLKTYAQNRDITSHDEVAVIVQEMVDAQFAGVAFGADPVSGARDTTLVSAVSGLGEKLVSGAVDSENWSISRANTIDGSSQLLTPEQILAITKLTRQCNAHFGSPQDIEWAIGHDDQLWLLQSRPITTLAKIPDPADELTVWDNSNIAESYGGITSPLTYSFATRIYEHVYREFCKLLHVPPWKITQSDQVFPQMLGQIQGRVYYNLVSWYRVLALLPGFSVNRSFMEQMMGVKQPLPEEIVEKIITENATSKWRDSLALLKTSFGLIRSYLRLPKQIATFQTRLNSALALKTPLSQLRTDELIAHYRHLEKQLLHRWDAPLVNDFFAMIFYGILSKKTEDPNAYLRDTGDIISARPPRLIKEMAKLARPHDNLVNLLTSNATSAKKIAEVRNFPELYQKLQAYLQEFGDRCLEELKLESPTVTDDPSSLLQSIGSFATRDFKEPEPERTDPPTGFFRKFLVNKTRSLIRNRENLRFERTRVFGRVRRIMRELGRRLHADHQLEAIDDIFFLTLDEVLETGRTQNLKTLVIARKAEFETYHASDPPPDRFTTRGPLHRHSTFESDSPSTSTESDLQGIGACAGIVRGPVRVVTNPREATLRPGEILVATQTDPGWVVLFPAASGLLVERGSLLSHSAIVARELDLPCIVSLTNITKTLKTGDQIEMNGRTGQVTLLEHED